MRSPSVCYAERFVHHAVALQQTRSILCSTTTSYTAQHSRRRFQNSFFKYNRVGKTRYYTNATCMALVSRPRRGNKTARVSSFRGEKGTNPAEWMETPRPWAPFPQKKKSERTNEQANGLVRLVLFCFDWMKRACLHFSHRRSRTAPGKKPRAPPVVVVFVFVRPTQRPPWTAGPPRSPGQSRCRQRTRRTRRPR